MPALDAVLAEPDLQRRPDRAHHPRPRGISQLMTTHHNTTSQHDMQTAT
jgi:hypothetical protein